MDNRIILKSALDKYDLDNDFYYSNDKFLMYYALYYNCRFYVSRGYNNKIKYKIFKDNNLWKALDDYRARKIERWEDELLIECKDILRKAREYHLNNEEAKELKGFSSILDKLNKKLKGAK